MEVPTHKAVEPGCVASVKTGMLAAGISFEEKGKLGVLALVARLLGHYIYIQEKRKPETPL